MPEGITATVAAFGNPAIWWLCLPTLVAAGYLGWRRRDRVLGFLMVIFLSQYLPWMVVPRKVTFIYHFFPMVPLLVLLLIRVLQLVWLERQADKLSLKPLKLIYGVYFGLAAALFIAFYPVISGATSSVWYIDHFLKWLPGWYF